jgi:hypothetical protein
MVAIQRPQHGEEDSFSIRKWREAITSRFNQFPSYGGTSTGSANTYTITTSIPTFNTSGIEVRFKAHQTNTASSTLTIGANTYTFKRSDGSTNLAGLEIASGSYITAVLDGTSAILAHTTPIWETFTASAAAVAPMTTSTLTTDYSRHRRDIDGRVHFEISFSCTTVGPASNSFTFNLGIAPTTGGTNFHAGIADGGYYHGQGVRASGVLVTVYRYDYANWGIDVNRAVVIKASYV